SACFAYLYLLNFRDSYYARSGLLNHLSSDGFDCWRDRLFDFPSGFLHWRALGLRLCNRLRLRSLACFTAFGCVSPSQFCSLLYLRSLLAFSHDRPPFSLVPQSIDVRSPSSGNLANELSPDFTLGAT